MKPKIRNRPHGLWKSRTTLFLLLLVVNFGYAQTDHFTEIEVTKSIVTKNNNSIFSVKPNFRMILNDAHWKRIGMDGAVKRKYRNWGAFTGLASFYVFDNDIQNFLELRPYIGLTLQNNIVEHFNFKQTLRYEFRNMFYRDSRSNIAQSRVRLNLALAYTLENPSSPASWEFRTEAEFYMIKQQEFQERFVNSREYTFKIIRGIGKDRSLGISYHLEKFNKNFDREDRTGHTFGVEYNF